MGSHAAAWFVPWEILPAIYFLIFGNLTGPRRALRAFFIVSVFTLTLLGLTNKWSPHHWMLAWVVPFLLLVEMGFESLCEFKNKGIALGWLVAAFALTIGQTFTLANIIRESGGTGWHHSTLRTKREILSFIAERYPHSPIRLARPGTDWGGSRVGWMALVSFKDEFGSKLLLEPQDNSSMLVIEERGSEGSNQAFAATAQGLGWQVVYQIGSCYLWMAPGTGASTLPELTRIKI